MTKDLALITTKKDVTVLNSEDFIKEIRKTFEAFGITISLNCENFIADPHILEYNICNEV